MRKLTLVLPLALTLAACAPAVVRTGDARLTATARVPGGRTRGRLPGSPPPVMCAAASSSPARCSASTGFT